MGIEITKSSTIDVSAEKLWAILADDFDKIGDWARGVDSSTAKTDATIPEGASMGGRVCQAPGFGAVDESFTSFDAEQHSYAFEATANKIPSFVRNITNNTSVKSLGPDQSEIQVKITADTDGIRGTLVKPMIARKFSSAVDDLIADLTVFAETGEISSEKKKALAKSGH